MPSHLSTRGWSTVSTSRALLRRFHPRNAWNPAVATVPFCWKQINPEKGQVLARSRGALGAARAAIAAGVAQSVGDSFELPLHPRWGQAGVSFRSEERRGGEEGRSRWAPDH